MQIDGAIIKEQGITFAVVVVKRDVVENSSKAQSAIMSFMPAFPGLPVVLMAQNHKGVPTYYGRKDISRFMASVPLQAISWRHYTIN